MGFYVVYMVYRDPYFMIYMVCYKLSLSGGCFNPWMKNVRKSNWIISPGSKIKNVWNHPTSDGFVGDEIVTT